MYLGLNSPMPFTLISTHVIGSIYFMTCLWFVFPNELRQNEDFRKRLKGFYIYFWARFFLRPVQFIVLRVVFFALPTDFQLVMALVIPITREVNERILGKLVERIGGGYLYPKLCKVKLENQLAFKIFIAIICDHCWDYYNLYDSRSRLHSQSFSVWKL